MSEEVIVHEAADEGATVGTVTLVAATDHTLVSANVSRDGLYVSAGVADVWLSYGTSPAVVGSGHCVRSGGAPFIDRSWKGEVHVISTGAATIGWTETDFAFGYAQGELPTGADTFAASGPADSVVRVPTITQPVPPPPLDPSK